VAALRRLIAADRTAGHRVETLPADAG
jgi:hypothetical protein